MVRSTSRRPKFTYKPTAEAARKRAEQSGSSRDVYIDEDVKLYKPAEGDNLLRIMTPTWEGAEHYGFDIFVHYQVGADQGAYLCPAKMNHGDGRCPICEERERAERNGDKEYAKRLRPNKRVLFYVLDRDKEAEGLKAWAAPWTVDKDIMTQAYDPRTREVIPLTDEDEGYDIRLTRVGQEKKTEYTVSIMRRPSSIEYTDDMVDLLENKPIPTLLRFYPYEYIKRVFEGGVGMDEEEEEVQQEEERAPAKPAARRGSSRQAAQELTRNYVMGLEGEALDDLVDQQGLDLDASTFGSDEELAEAICEALGLEEERKQRASTSRRSLKSREPEPEEEEEEQEEEEEEEEKPSAVKDRLAAFRNRRR